jgi:rSAM/selenodomain-associated transferase 1
VTTALIVLAKAPVPGLAKTRLAPALGLDGAAVLAERLQSHTLAQALALPGAACELCVSPSTDHPAFTRAVAVAAGRLQLTLQGDGDLGARMHRALARALRVHDQAALAAAASALDTHDAVFVPALDGGYALVGLARPAPGLFDGMAWSTPQVLAESLRRAARLGLRVATLAPVADIDEAADLVHLPPGWLA